MAGWVNSGFGNPGVAPARAAYQLALEDAARGCLVFGFASVQGTVVAELLGARFAGALGILGGIHRGRVRYVAHGLGQWLVRAHLVAAQQLYRNCRERNRAAADVRSTFTKHNGSLGEPGSVGYLFEQKGYLLVTGDEETVMLAAIDGGADDIEPSGDQWEIISPPSDLASVRRALERAGVQIDQGEVTHLPTTSVPVNAETAPKVLGLVDALEDLDDVQAVYANFDIPDDVLADISA